MGTLLCMPARPYMVWTYLLSNVLMAAIGAFSSDTLGSCMPQALLTC